MLLHLIRREILDQLLSMRFLSLSAFAGLVIWAGLLEGMAYQKDGLASFSEAQNATNDRIDQIAYADDSIVPTRHYWGELFNVGFLVHKSPSPLSLFARGVEPFLGRTIRVKGYTDRRFVRSRAAEETETALHLPLDLALIVQIVLGLFVLLNTHDVICGEKERGTLALTISHPVPRSLLLLAKLFGTFVPTLLALVVPLALGLAVMVALPGNHFGTAEWVRIGLIFSAYALYLLTLTCVGLLGSALTRRPSTSLALLMGFWIIVVIIVPRLSLIAADGIVGAPSVAELEGNRRKVFWDAVYKRYADTSAWRKAYQERSGESPWRSPEGREEFYMNVREFQHTLDMEARRVRDGLDRDYDNRFDVWLELGRNLARLSPAFAMSNSVVTLAGTGFERHRQVTRLCGFYLDEHLDWSHSTFHRDSLRRANPDKNGAFEWDVADMPRFSQQHVWHSEDVEAAFFDFGIMMAWALIFFIGAHVAMLRYDCR